MNSMTLSSFGGLPLLRQEEQHLAIASQLASCITDRRRKYLVHHSLEEIILTLRQFKEGVKGDRLSCHTFNANRMRIFLHGMAYNLMLSLRERALKDTSLEKATLLTIRERILLTAVSVKVLKTKVLIEYPKYHPMYKELSHALRFYQRAA